MNTFYSDIVRYTDRTEPREWLSIAFIWAVVLLMAAIAGHLDFSGWPLETGPRWAELVLAGIMTIPLGFGIYWLEWDTK